MSNSKTRTVNTESSKSTQQTTFDPASQREQAIMNDYYGLGRTQSDFLKNLMTGGNSIFQLDAPANDELNKAYQSAFDRFVYEGKDYADYLSSTKGMSKGSTPVSQQAMERYGLGMADLLSQQANARLNLGLQGTMAKLGAVGATPGGHNAAFVPMYNERMAGGMTTRTGSGRSDQTTYNSPSVMQQISNGMSLGSQAIGLGAQLGGMFMGIPSPTSFMGGLGGAQTGISTNPNMYSSAIGPVMKPMGMGLRG
jgi:hypothetical protein